MWKQVCSARGLRICVDLEPDTDPPSAPWPLTSLRKRAAWVLNLLTLPLSPPPSLSSLGQAERPISLISPPPLSSCSSLIMGFASAVCYNKRAREDMKGGEALWERGESRGHRRGNLPSVSSCPPSLGCFINLLIPLSPSYIFPGDIKVLNGLQSVMSAEFHLWGSRWAAVLSYHSDRFLKIPNAQIGSKRVTFH